MPGSTLKSSLVMALGLTWLPAAVLAAGPDPRLELMELDEVVVHGERLITRITSAEDEFYQLYNQINKDDRYDVSCPFLTLGANSTSRINTRLCLPGFVAEAIADYTAFKVSCEPTFPNFDANRDRRISRMEASANPDLFSQFDSLDQDDDEQLDEFGEFRAFELWALANQNCHRPPLDDLHRELATVQRRYRDVAAQESEARHVDKTPDLRRSGPRR